MTFEDKVMARPDSVLFVCSQNAIRSPMAEALLRRLFRKQIYVRSAGVFTGTADPFIIDVMKEVGLDVSHHEPIAFDVFEERGFDLVVTLAPDAHHHLIDATRTSAAVVEYWPIPDPSLASGNREQRLSEYRLCRDIMLTKMKSRFHWSAS